MRAWTKLKEILNEGTYLSRDTLVRKVLEVNNVWGNTVYNYLNILEESRYIDVCYEPLSKYESVRIAHYKLLKKIPKKLTIVDAKKIAKMPWLAWFKYPE